MKIRNVTLGLSALSVGVLLGADQNSKQIFIGGEIQRAGLYQVSKPDTTIAEAAVLAGVDKPGADYSVLVFQHIDNKIWVLTSYFSLQDLKAAKIDGVVLHDGDNVTFLHVVK